MTVIWQWSVICWFFWVPTHYDLSYGMPMKTSALRVYQETWWLLWSLWVPFVTQPYDLLVSLRQNCLLDTRIFFLLCVITIQKWDFSVMIQKKLKISCKHHFSTNPPTPACLCSGTRINITVVSRINCKSFVNENNWSLTNLVSSVITVSLVVAAVKIIREVSEFL